MNADGNSDESIVPSTQANNTDTESVAEFGNHFAGVRLESLRGGQARFSVFKLSHVMITRPKTENLA